MFKRVPPQHFLDIKKACDNVPSLVVHRLEELGCNRQA